MSARPRSGLNRAVGVLDRAVGAAAGSTLALALLVCGCVFAALAGPAISLHTRSEALQQTLAGLALTTKAVQVSADWSNFTNALAPTTNSDLTLRTFTEAAREIRGSLAAVPLPLGGGAWAGLSANPFTVAAGAPPRAFIGPAPPRLEVLYRDPLTSNAALVAGSYAAPVVPSVRRLPGCSANRAAVCGVAATAMVPAGSTGAA